MTSKAVLIVTGAWHVAEHYSRLASTLNKEGIRVICETLPTNADPELPPVKTVDDDVDFIKHLVSREVSQGTHLTVLAHSYGGVVATAALSEFVVSSNSAQGGVTDLIYMAAFVPFENIPLAGIFGGELPPYISRSPYKTLTWNGPIPFLYNDMTPEDVAWAISLKREHHISAAQDAAPKCDKAAWRTVRTSYLVCENDKAIPPPVQEMMFERVRTEGIEVKVYTCKGSHSPFISMPDEVARIVTEVMAQ